MHDDEQDGPGAGGVDRAVHAVAHQVRDQTVAASLIFERSIDLDRWIDSPPY